MGGAAQRSMQCHNALLPDITDLPWQEAFPLEPICMFVDGKKMTSDTGAHIWYADGCQVACSFFHRTSRLFTDAFDEVDWPQVHRMLNEEVLRLFQVIAVTNKNLYWRHHDWRSNKCPCCTIHMETAEHIMLCPEEGLIDTFQLATTALECWLNEADMDPDLADCIVEYVQQQGTVTMEEIVREAPRRFRTMGLSQDKIGRRRFLEGMISKEITVVQRQFYALKR
jgi:hypothetical protein